VLARFIYYIAYYLLIYLSGHFSVGFFGFGALYRVLFSSSKLSNNKNGRRILEKNNIAACCYYFLFTPSNIIAEGEQRTLYNSKSDKHCIITTVDL